MGRFWFIMQCPQCGAENPDGSTFCSLCLTIFPSLAWGNISQSVAVPPSSQQVIPTPQPVQTAPISQPSYVSPSDYHALAREMYQSPYPPMPPGSSYGNTPYYQAAMGYPGVGSAVPPPPLVSKKSVGGIIGLILKHSFLMFLLLFGVWTAIGSIFYQSNLSESQTSWGIARFLTIGLTVLVLILAGYRISMEAHEPGKGWIYGTVCVAMIMMVWLTLFFFLIVLALTRKTFILIFEPVILLMTIFLYLPMGALGGWIAERRYMV
jgi:hypothetical protein